MLCLLEVPDVRCVSIYAGGCRGRPPRAGAVGVVEVESRDPGDGILFCNVGSGLCGLLRAQFGRCGGVLSKVRKLVLWECNFNSDYE